MPSEHIYNHSAIGRELNATSLEVLETDLDTAMTFAHIAQRSKTDPEKKLRNQANARKAYDTVLDFEKRLELTIEQKQHLTAKLSAVKSALLRLGEVF